jgi:hypothetical protein
LFSSTDNITPGEVKTKQFVKVRLIKLFSFCIALWLRQIDTEGKTTQSHLAIKWHSESCWMWLLLGQTNLILTKYVNRWLAALRRLTAYETINQIISLIVVLGIKTNHLIIDTLSFHHLWITTFLSFTCFVDQPGFEVGQNDDAEEGLDQGHVIGFAEFVAVKLDVPEISQIIFAILQRL